MRIIAGKWRGRPLVAPAGQGTRPTSDRAREGLFSMLVSRIGSFEGLRVADLFAGSGALGLEALSRGASHCLFVDRDPGAIASIRRNVETLSAGSMADIRQQSAEMAPAPRQSCHLIFLDPPYASGVQEQALVHVANERWIEAGGLISMEAHTDDLPCPPGFTVEARRRFGKAHIHLFRHESPVVQPADVP